MSASQITFRVVSLTKGETFAELHGYGHAVMRANQLAEHCSFTEQFAVMIAVPIYETELKGTRSYSGAKG